MWIHLVSLSGGILARGPADGADNLPLAYITYFIRAFRGDAARAI